MALNYVFMMGRMAEEPVLKVAKSKVQYVRFNLYVDREYKATNNFGKRGYFTKTHDIIPCVAWGKQAEAIKRYCSKGNLLLIIGKLETWAIENSNTGQFQKLFNIKVVQAQIFDWRRKVPVNTETLKKDRFDSLFDDLNEAYNFAESLNNRKAPEVGVDDSKLAGASNDPYVPTFTEFDDMSEVLYDAFGDGDEFTSEFEDEEDEEESEE